MYYANYVIFTDPKEYGRISLTKHEYYNYNRLQIEDLIRLIANVYKPFEITSFTEE